ncbi:hypothetical protein B0T25DRAFT_204584 [Lasiosphaeria hispida]|uniref:Uncharacterized protein n=1 Tax=Lasiosphaeria hispida TaxID=260671 RepID=A0AAJ0HIG4_9PEZI|nr:hypothetical protein B0T25DRAFT_204584 [Lasiosphaeria hispida]
MSSNVSTPYLEPYTSQTLPSPSPLATNPPLTTLDDDIPPLSLDILSKHDDKVEALRLVADSIAQQRQQAAYSLVLHPLLVAGLAATLALLYRHAYIQQRLDLGAATMMATGFVMSYLVAIRWAASGYLRAAEELKWDWLVGEDGEEDVVIGTRFGKDFIGALVLRLEPNPAGAGKKKNRSLSLKGGKGVVRAWTTKLKYRGKGVGEDMLREAARITRERCGRDAEVGFAAEHANSVRVLPDMFNTPFRRQEMKAARALEAVVGELEKRKR